ncbi:MAG TPA: class I SAM-dependent methyltransferase [Stellaceae bacterium]|nr:class I SAM-dependent methyltransferase [Stellaceae bacterium]
MKTYEELSGARGREMFYRAERYRAADLFRRQAPALTLDSDNYLLRNISLSGIGAASGRGINHLPEVGQRVNVLLGVPEYPLFEGKGEIARIEPRPIGANLGVRIVDRCIDIGQIVTRYQRFLIQTDLDTWGAADAEVSPAYRQLCSDVLHLLRSYRAGLDRFEAMKPDADAAADMLAACEERLLPRWRALWLKGNELVAPIDRSGRLWQAAKRYTELVLTPDFLLGAFARRCYQKPLGYPGDFEVMNMAYDWRHEGEKLSDKLIHRVGLEVGECIANRMTMMRQAIAAAAADPARPVLRVASLGSGPAREVVDFLKIPTLPRPVDITLIDQDHAALSHAYERTLPEVMRHKGQATISCLHSSFAQLLKTGELFGKLPSQDLIYSVGLVDYLSARRAKALVESLYQHLAPGGMLLVGNMKAGATSTLWPVEFITDWSLAYRDGRELLELGADLPGAALSLTDDKTGRVCVLNVRKS